MKLNKILISVVFTLIISILFLLCKDDIGDNVIIKRDMKKIRAKKKLIALTDYNSTSYFIYRGRPMGFHYDLLKLLEKKIGVKIELTICNNISESLLKLNNGECDLIAMNLTVTDERSKNISFITPHSNTKQVLVQRKPKGWTNLSAKEVNKLMIRTKEELSGKSIHIPESSAYYDELKSISDSINGLIDIIEVSNYESEQLVSLVADGEIDYAICDENVAIINSKYYPNIDIKMAINKSQDLAWAVRKNSPVMQHVLSNWISEINHTKEYRIIYNKYFKTSRVNSRRISGFLSVEGGGISSYDYLIQKYSKSIEWDWRLLAALIATESAFNHNAVSWAGAFGLMQLMPLTAAEYGVDTLSSAEDNIAAGVKYLKWIENQLIKTIPDKDERINFILASYNAGIGHVMDARALAEKHGSNPNVWKGNVDKYILYKSKPEYFNDPVVKYGYCRGRQTYMYVYNIMELYFHYQNSFHENPIYTSL